LIALDASTGAQLWSQSTGSSQTGPCVSRKQGPVGAAAVVGQRVFAPGADGSVHAFDKDSGSQLWSTQIADTSANNFLWSSAFPVGDKVYLGVATLIEDQCATVVPGRLVALDQSTGAVTGTWWADQNHGNGGGIWTSPAYDPASNRVFVATGNVDAGKLPSDEPWQQAIVAIDPATMKTAAAFQPIHTDFGTDWDFGGSPTLYDLSDGRHLVADTNKNGNVYAFDRDNLGSGVLWTTEISAPGTSPDVGESSIVSPVYANGLLFVAGGKTSDGKPGAIAALNPATGAVVWKINPDGFVLPALAASGGVVAAAVSKLPDNTGKLYVLDQTTGEVLFTLSTSERIFAQPTWANGTLYVVDLAGNLYALRP